jgi:hypothetical protein
MNARPKLSLKTANVPLSVQAARRRFGWQPPAPMIAEAMAAHTDERAAVRKRADWSPEIQVAAKTLNQVRLEFCRRRAGLRARGYTRHPPRGRRVRMALHRRTACLLRSSRPRRPTARMRRRWSERVSGVPVEAKLFAMICSETMRSVQAPQSALDRRHARNTTPSVALCDSEVNDCHTPKRRNSINSRREQREHHASCCV